MASTAAGPARRQRKKKIQLISEKTCGKETYSHRFGLLVARASPSVPQLFGEAQEVLLDGAEVSVGPAGGREFDQSRDHLRVLA